MRSSQTRKIPDTTYYLLVILCVGFFIRLIYVLTVGRNLFFNYLSDAGLYHSWALEIIHTGTSKWASFMGFLYPNIVSIIYRIFGTNPVHILVFQVLLDVATIYLVFLIGRMLWGKRTALLAAFIYALFAPAIFYAGLLSMTPLLAFFNTLVAYLLLVGFEKKDNYAMIAAGLFSGIEALAQSNILFFLPFLFSFFLRHRRMTAFAIYLLVLLVPIAYASLRNSIAMKQPVLLSSNLGINFYIGNNPDANGMYRRPQGLDLTNDFTGQKIAGKLTGRDLNQSAVSRYWFGQGLRFVFGQPGRAAYLFLKKIAYYISRYELPQAENFYYARRLSVLLGMNPFVFGLIGALGLVGIYLFWNDDKRRLLALLYIAIAASYILFFVIGRLRHPATPILVVFAAAAVDRGLTVFKERNRKEKTLLVVLVGAAAAVVWLPTAGMSATRMLVTTKCDESISLMYQGRFDDAERILTSILAKNPEYAPAENNLGNLWLRRGMVEKALPRYRRAVEMDSTEGDYHANYGIALFLAGELADAKSELLKAKALLPYYLSLDANLAQVSEVSDVMKMNPAEGYLVMAENVLSINDIDRAITLFKRSLALSPKSLRALNDLAVAYHRKGRIDDAIGTLERALTYYPDNTDLLYNKGMMHFEKGERDKAIGYWGEVLRIDPDNEDVRQLLKRVSPGG